MFMFPMTSEEPWIRLWKGRLEKAVWVAWIWKEFKIEYKEAREREEFMIQYCHRPKSSYISDALGVDEYVWNMDNMKEYYLL